MERKGAEGQALVRTFTLNGIEALPVEVQVAVDPGYPRVTIVGLPDRAVRESLDRILAAFHSAGFGHPDRHVTVNLAPAELRKEGAALDLPIALGMAAALGCFDSGVLRTIHVAGELALNGDVLPIRGSLAMALAVAAAGEGTLLLPAQNVSEASDVPGLTVRPLRSLAVAVGCFRNDVWPEVGEPPGSAPAGDSLAAETGGISNGPDFRQVRGQVAAKRALEIAAAGGHNLLMVGPPGAGKTLLAQRLPGILPPLTPAESIEVTVVQSVAGMLKPGCDRVRTRPFRAPHHTITGPGLVGGGAVPQPGEVSLAHGGVLFLDEVPEFRASVLDLLRQPLEEGCVRLVRSGRMVNFPSRFVLLGAMNPCPCGFLGHPRKPCRCTPHQVKLYRNRLSGPLLDRIDLHVEVPAVTAREITKQGTTGEETSSAIRTRVEVARQIQLRRYGNGVPSPQMKGRHPAGLARGHHIHSNAQMGLAEIAEHCRIDEATRAFLEKAIESLSLSARAAHRALKVARTIADLAGDTGIALKHVAEAVQYQAPDRASDAG